MTTFTPEFIKLAKKMKMTPEALWASQSIGAETVNLKGSTIPSTADAKAKLEASAKATTTTASEAKLPPEVFVPRAIRKLRPKEGEMYEVTKVVLGPDGKAVKDKNGRDMKVGTGEMRPKSKGLNAKIDLNPVLRDYYGKDFDCRKCTEELATKGLIVIKPAHGSVTVFLPEDRPVSTRKSRLAEVLAD